MSETRRRAPHNSQVGVFSREDRIHYTREWTGERFPDGRPKVPDGILERMKQVTITQAWGILRGAGYNHQYEGNWQCTHPGQVLVGRAVTAVYMPRRPDIRKLLGSLVPRRSAHSGATARVGLL